jgi:hypothetical protein
MLEKGEPGSGASFGMKQRPDGDLEIDSKFFQEDFQVPACEQCGGTLKPDVSDIPASAGTFMFGWLDCWLPQT